MRAAGWRLFLVCVVVFAGGVIVTVLTRVESTTVRAETPEATLSRWLALDEPAAQVIRELDPGFSDELTGLRTVLDNARTDLAALFERPDVSPDLLRQQAETVIAAHNAVERRVLDYILRVRDHLTPAQQKRLFELCAESVRTCKQRQWGRGHQRGALDAVQDHEAKGRGPCDQCGRGRHREGADGAKDASGVRPGPCDKCGRGGHGDK
ncbi:MAG: periplasmic heavy metal sensor [Planctomycetota bacterium]